MPIDEFRNLESPEMKRQLDHGVRTPWSLHVLIAANILAWLATLLAPGNVAGFMGDPDSLHLYRSGALNAHAVLVKGEYWRLLAGPFLHANWFHIGMNAGFLWYFGRYAVRWYGNSQFLLLYLLCALFGALASLHFGASVSISIGASGAVYGVMAAMACSIYQHRSLLHANQFQKLAASYGIYLAGGIAYGFTEPGIDNAAHLGGAAMGAYLGWFLSERFESGELQALSRERRTLAAVPMAIAFGLAFMTVPFPNSDTGRVLEEYVPLQHLHRETRALASALDEVREVRVYDQTYVLPMLESELLPRLRRLQQRIESVDEAPREHWNDVRTALHAYVQAQTRLGEAALRYLSAQQQATDEAQLQQGLRSAIKAAEEELAAGAHALNELRWPVP